MWPLGSDLAAVRLLSPNLHFYLFHQYFSSSKDLNTDATHLVVVEDGVSHGVFPWHRVGPQLLHEEHLIGE